MMPMNRFIISKELDEEFFHIHLILLFLTFTDTHCIKILNALCFISVKMIKLTLQIVHDFMFLWYLFCMHPVCKSMKTIISPKRSNFLSSSSSSAEGAF